MYVCVCVCVYVCMYVCMYVCVSYIPALLPRPILHERVGGIVEDGVCVRVRKTEKKTKHHTNVIMHD